MDVNYILAREQIELALARASTDAGSRAAHQSMADHHRARIDAYRDAVVSRAAGRFGATAAAA